MTVEKNKGTDKKSRKSPVRSTLKKKLTVLKKVREEAKTAKDTVKLERIRRQYRRVTHALRKMAAPRAKAVKAE